MVFKFNLIAVCLVQEEALVDLLSLYHDVPCNALYFQSIYSLNLYNTWNIILILKYYLSAGDICHDGKISKLYNALFSISCGVPPDTSYITLLIYTMLYINLLLIHNQINVTLNSKYPFIF